MNQKMSSTPPSKIDASISLEGVGLIGTTLSKALATVQQKRGMESSESPGTSAPNALTFTASDIAHIKTTFGKAFLESQRDATNQDLDASLLGLSEHYNRVGLNWRIVGNMYQLKEGQPLKSMGSTSMKRIDDVHHNEKANDTIFIPLLRAQILAFGDR